MNRIVLRVSLRSTFWLLPYFWRNHYTYVIRRTHPTRTERGLGHRFVWLFVDCELAILPRGAYWNPDGAHLQPQD